MAASTANAYVIPPPSCSRSPVSSRKLQRKLANLQDMDMSGWTPPPPTPADYVFVPPEVGAEIWVGSIVALVPIVWASYEFYNRIATQQRCLACSGSGLVSVTRQGNPLSRPRKCFSCGGFLPWLGWKMFFLSTMAPGNGGALQRPAKDYEEINERIRQERAQALAQDQDDSIL
ncbi:hypothetical protein B484DRAFT_396256 [Ochromonadaceae sp. CCMP2298]|nr:hypothetical protein B484DRAFT_396256 [Ochromonadaceae sp. CCMP2298]